MNCLKTEIQTMILMEIGTTIVNMHGGDVGCVSDSQSLLACLDDTIDSGEVAEELFDLFFFILLATSDVTMKMVK